MQANRLLPMSILSLKSSCECVRPSMDEDENTVLVCKEIVGDGFVIQPTAPDTCNSVGVEDILNGHM